MESECEPALPGCFQGIFVKVGDVYFTVCCLDLRLKSLDSKYVGLRLKSRLYPSNVTDSLAPGWSKPRLEEEVGVREWLYNFTRL